jgi:26S proteasome regulatory subunit N11
MGVMLGEYVDEFTISVVDVYSMPSIASTVSVESIDPVY